MAAGSSPKKTDADFLFTEIQLACKVLDSGRISSNLDHIRKCYDLAISAYATVQHYLHTFKINVEDRKRIIEQLKRLELRLEEFTASALK